MHKTSPACTKRQKNAVIGNFCHVFCHFSPPYRHKTLQKFLHVVEEALSFNWWVICENRLRNSFRNEQNVRQPQILTLLQHVYVAELKYLEHSQSECACCGLIT